MIWKLEWARPRATRKQPTCTEGPGIDITKSGKEHTKNDTDSNSTTTTDSNSTTTTDYTTTSDCISWKSSNSSIRKSAAASLTNSARSAISLKMSASTLSAPSALKATPLPSEATPPHEPSNEPQSGKGKQDSNASICVGNISVQTSEFQLEDVFKAFGRIKRIHLVKDKKTSISRGLAFIHFVRPKDAARALEELQGYRCDYTIWNLEWARPKAKQLKGTKEPTKAKRK